MRDSDIDLEHDRGAFRDVPYMGVIFVVDEAHKRGFWNGHPDWSNLGQGQPEVGEIAGAPPRRIPRTATSRQPKSSPRSPRSTSPPTPRSR